MLRPIQPASHDAYDRIVLLNQLHRLHAFYHRYTHLAALVYQHRVEQPTRHLPSLGTLVIDMCIKVEWFATDDHFGR